jgi:putative membrane protein (TIGR04086 family)
MVEAERGEGMVVNQKPTGRATNTPIGVGIGGFIAYLLTLIMSGLLAWLLAAEYINTENTGYGSMIIIILSAALGSLVAQGLVKHRKLIVCLASGFVYYALLLGTTALFFGGQYQGMGVTLGIILAGSGSVGLLVANKKKSITKGYRIPSTG